MTLRIETELEEDGRWIAEIPEMPGVMVYGNSEEDAIRRVAALALRVEADKLEHKEGPVEQIHISFDLAS